MALSTQKEELDDILYRLYDLKLSPHEPISDDRIKGNCWLDACEEFLESEEDFDALCMRFEIVKRINRITILREGRTDLCESIVKRAREMLARWQQNIDQEKSLFLNREPSRRGLPNETGRKR